MKNSIVSILLFIILVSCLFYLDCKFTTLCDEIITKCEEIEIYLNDDNKAIAYEESIKLLEQIKDEGDVPAIYLNHIDYDFLISESLKLSLYIIEDDKAESMASLHLLRYGAEHLRELQRPNFNNIL